MNYQMNDAGRLRHRKPAGGVGGGTHIPQDPGYHACGGPTSFSPRPPYVRQHEYSTSQSSSTSSTPCQFHTAPEYPSHARSQSYSNPYQQQQNQYNHHHHHHQQQQQQALANGQRHSNSRQGRPIYTQGKQQRNRYGPENSSNENMARKNSAQKANNPASAAAQQDQYDQPAILKLTSVLATIATLPGRKVARAAKKLYSYPRNSLSDPDLTDISGQPARRRNGGTGTCPGTPPPDYDAAMESDVEGDSDFDAGMGTEGGGEIERRTESALMADDENEISRKFAKQGHHLLTLSLAEIDNSNGQGSSSTALTSLDPNSFSNSFTRQLYVHSLTYLLRALPQSLTIEEVAGITSALPESVLDSISYQESLQHHQHGPCCCHQVVELPPATLPKHPTLHKLTMLSASSVVTVMRTMTPHLKLLILQLWLFCQRHRVAERGVDMMKNCGDYGLWAGGILMHWLDIQGLLTDATTTMEESQAEVEVHGVADDGSGEVVVSGAAVARSTTVRRRIVRGGAEAGGKAIRDVSSWVGGVVSSGVSGVVDGISAGMEKQL